MAPGRPRLVGQDQPGDVAAAQRLASRSQTFKVQGSTDNQNFTDLTASKAYTFDSTNDQSTTISFDTTTTRYVRALFTANTGWPAGQASELEVYGPATGDIQAPTAPSNLSYTEPATGQIKLTWSAATDDTAVTGYDVYANGQLRASVAGNVLTYTDTQPAGSDITYFVRAKDAAGNVSANSNSVTRKGSSGDTQAPTAPGNLAYTQSGNDVKLTWQASSDNVQVTGYDVYANNQVVKTVAGDVTTYTDTPSTGATVTYYVKAKDAAGNVSVASNSVTRTGSGSGSDLAQASPSRPPHTPSPTSPRTPTTGRQRPTGRARAVPTRPPSPPSWVPTPTSARSSSSSTPMPPGPRARRTSRCSAATRMRRRSPASWPRRTTRSTRRAATR